MCTSLIKFATVLNTLTLNAHAPQPIQISAILIFYSCPWDGRVWFFILYLNPEYNSRIDPIYFYVNLSFECNKLILNENGYGYFTYSIYKWNDNLIPIHSNQLCRVSVLNILQYKFSMGTGSKTQHFSMVCLLIVNVLYVLYDCMVLLS